MATSPGQGTLRRIVHLTPRQTDAYFHLLKTLTDTELRFRPTAALALAMGIDPSRARIYILALRKAGVVFDVPGTHGIAVRGLCGGVHTHAYDHPCTKKSYIIAGQWPGKKPRPDKNPLPPEGGSTRSGFCWYDLDLEGRTPQSCGRAINYSSHREELSSPPRPRRKPTTGSSPAGEVGEEELPKRRGEMKAKAVNTRPFLRVDAVIALPVDIMNREAAAETRRKRRAEKPPIPNDMLRLGNLYAEVRVKWDAGYVIWWNRRNRRDLEELLLTFKRRRVAEHNWRPYLVWAFKRFHKYVTDANPLPISVAAHDDWVDQWTGSLGKRQYSLKHIQKMLRSVGLQVKRPDIVRTWCTEAKIRGGGIDPTCSEGPHRKAAEWLLPRLDRVRYEDEEPPEA